MDTSPVCSNGHMGEVLFKAKIPLDSHKTKKNARPIFRNKKTGKVFLGKDKDLVTKEKCLIEELTKLWKDKDPIICDVHVKYIFAYDYKTYYTKRGSRSNRVGDLDNLVQMPQDCLIKAGIIKNDSQVESLDGSRRFPREFTYLEIVIYNFHGG